MDDDDTAAGAYRQLMGGLDAAAQKLAATERARSAELAAQVPNLAASMHAAGELRQHVRRVASRMWERAHGEILWREDRWLIRREFPEPREGMGADDLDGFEVELAERAVNLEVARRRRWWELFSR